MKVKSVIVLLAIAFSILSPLSVHLTIAHEKTSIGTFDVCHAGSLAVSGSLDMPTMSEPVSCPFVPSYKDGVEILELTYQPFILIFQEEHPPKV